MAITDDDLGYLSHCVQLARHERAGATVTVDVPAAEFSDTMKSLYQQKFRP